MKKLIIIFILGMSLTYINKSKACEPVPTPTPSPSETPLLSLQLRGD